MHPATLVALAQLALLRKLDADHAIAHHRSMPMIADRGIAHSGSVADGRDGAGT